MAEPVPHLLRGAWRRSSIVNDDGSTDTTSLVLWLQLDERMVDVRLPAQVAELATRGSLAACSPADLRLLATCEGATGRTTCTDVERDDLGMQRATAEWINRGPDDIAYQPATAYPEPGFLEWNHDGSVMTERAPSGAYVEVWHQVAAPDAPSQNELLADGSQIFVVGDLAVLAHDRRVPAPRAERLTTLVAEAGDSRSALARLVDCEFSIAERTDAAFIVTASTLPWRIGEELDVDL